MNESPNVDSGPNVAFGGWRLTQGAMTNLGEPCARLDTNVIPTSWCGAGDEVDPNRARIGSCLLCAHSSCGHDPILALLDLSWAHNQIHLDEDGRSIYSENASSTLVMMSPD